MTEYRASYGLRLLVVAALVLIWRAVPADATPDVQPRRSFNIFNLYWENDFFARTDRNYSNGIKLTWSTPLSIQEDGQLPHWSNLIMDRLPWMNDRSDQRAVSLSVGQNIYTPEKTERTDLIEDDRPYAGYSYFGIGFHVQSGYRRHVWEVDFGVVGPLSLAEETQNSVHHLFDSDLAEGWDHQLENEPTLDVITETKWRLLSGDLGGGWGFDLIPHLGARLGNVAVSANTGAEVRLGWYLGQEFGSCAIRPGCETITAAESNALNEFRVHSISFYVFLGVDGRVVLHDIFLDGNTFKDSHSVEREPLVADLIGGLAFRYKRARLSYAYVVRTPQFEEQDRSHIFGAITFSYSF